MAEFKSSFRFYKQLLKTSLKQAVTLKSAFFMRVIFMIFNNVLMLMMWGALFYRFKTINGWLFQDFMFMTGLCLSSFSIWPLFFRGAGIHMARLIEYGGLDAYIVQPRHILFHIACSVSDPSGLGDFITGVSLMLLSGLITFHTAAIVFLCFLSATICFLAFNILVSSLPFFFRQSADLSERIFYIFFNIAGYPGSIYGEWTKLIFCSLFPIGLISVLPVTILKTKSFGALGYSLLLSLFFLGFAIYVFKKGLKRYEGGNRFGVHGY